MMVISEVEEAEGAQAALYAMVLMMQGEQLFFLNAGK